MQVSTHECYQNMDLLQKIPKLDFSRLIHQDSATLPQYFVTTFVGQGGGNGLLNFDVHIVVHSLCFQNRVECSSLAAPPGLSKHSFCKKFQFSNKHSFQIAWAHYLKRCEFTILLQGYHVRNILEPIQSVMHVVPMMQATTPVV